MKYKKEFGEAIQTLMKQEFTYLATSIGKEGKEKEENEVEGKQNEIEVLMRRKGWEKTKK